MELQIAFVMDKKIFFKKKKKKKKNKKDYKKNI